MKFIINNTTDLSWFKFNNMSDLNGLHHFISTRKGGYSKPPYNSLNLGLKVDDDNQAVVKNRLALANALGISLDNFIVPSQCHSNNITIVTHSEKGRGVYEKTDAIEDTDALISVEKDLCLVIFGADCVPVLLFDPVKKVIAAAHAGWKGTVNKIVSDVVAKMVEKFDTNPVDVIAGIGPSMGPCCYNIGEDVAVIVRESYGSATPLLQFNKTSNKIYFNLWQANVENLMQSGLTRNNIEVSELCTSCHNDLFFSHRKSGGFTGRFGAGIMLK